MNKDNTFKEIAKDNPKDLIEVIVGDDKEPDVVLPQAKIQRWDNETNFSLRLKDFDNYSVIEDKGKIIFGDGKKELHLYDLPKGQGMEDGGFEVEAVLYEKPDTNKIDFTIQTKGLNFFFQPPLTPEEIAEGAQRPENVEGSYAVYHATKGGMNNAAGMEYKVGKAFHIYRPKIKDANGQEVWGELNVDVDKGELTVTVPQEFLDNALYPVIVDPTFGYTSSGASSANIADNNLDRSRRRARAYTFNGGTGTLDSISAYLGMALNSDLVDVTLSAHIEDISGQTHDNIAVIEQTDLSLTTTYSLKTFNASSQTIPGGKIILAALGDGVDVANGSDFARIALDTGASGNLYVEVGDYATVRDESPWSGPLDSFTDATSVYSIYATYTEPDVQVLPLDTYYWRVRAKDEWGVWGAWSSTRSFEINAGGGGGAPPTRGINMTTNTKFFGF